MSETAEKSEARAFTIRGKRACMYIPPSQDPDDHGGYVPSLVVEGESGHSPMLGKGVGAAPWVWGQTLAEAEAVCDKYNAERGVSRFDAYTIVASSMSARRE